MPLQRAAPFAQVDPDRPGDAARADAQMAVEPPVLGRHDGVDQMRARRVGVITPPNWSPRQAKTLPSRSSMVTEPRERVSTRLGHIGKLHVVIPGRHRDDQRHRNPAAPGQTPEKPKDEAEGRERSSRAGHGAVPACCGACAAFRGGGTYATIVALGFDADRVVRRSATSVRLPRGGGLRP
jgi:hypothetical protein